MDQVPQIVDPWVKYQQLEVLGQGAHGIIYKIRHRQTGQEYACKLLYRGGRVNDTLKRELINHRTLQPHPNVIGFIEVFLTNQCLGIVLEYANQGELFKRVQSAQRFPENLARFYFQQLISGIDHLHKSGICHRDIKLENSLIHEADGLPVLKICDFGYSKSNEMDSAPHSKVGTPSYVAPEVLSSNQNYNGQAADVWSAGVQLYIMLVGRYPFDDPNDPDNHQKTLHRIMKGEYEVPPELQLSMYVQDLLRGILVTDPAKRVGIEQIKSHPFYLSKLPLEIKQGYPPGCGINAAPPSQQPVESIDVIISAAKKQWQAS